MCFSVIPGTLNHIPSGDISSNNQDIVFPENYLYAE